MGRINMMTVYDVLRLHGTSGLSRAEIAQAAGVSTGTVSNTLARARHARVSWSTDFDPAAVHRITPAEKTSATGRTSRHRALPPPCFGRVSDCIRAKRDALRYSGIRPGPAPGH